MISVDTEDLMMSVLLSIAAIASQSSLPIDPTAALTGSWVGTLEYRDYSDNSRVKLGTLLRISRPKGEDKLVFRYVYDDGPHKVIQEEDSIEVDLPKNTYKVTSGDGKETSNYSFVGSPKLSVKGYGSFILNGRATENNEAVEIRETFKIGESTLDILRESKLPGKPWLFRHQFIFKRVG